jgi:hypothetical protein
MSLLKTFRLPGVSTPTSTVQVRLEVFNTFNWANLNNPVSAVDSTNFGRVRGQRGGTGGARVVQLAAKWMF